MTQPTETRAFPGPADLAAPSDPARAGDVDAALMERVRSGDRRAFECLVERHRNGLVAYLARMSGDVGVAQDLAQEAFLRLYRSADRYREQGHLQAYLYRIASNLLRSRERRERRFAWVALDPHRHDGRTEHTPQDATLDDEDTRRVCRAIRDLPWAFRAPLVLHAIEGWPLARIAESLGCREGTVKSRISRARRTLRRALTAGLEGGAS